MVIELTLFFFFFFFLLFVVNLLFTPLPKSNEAGIHKNLGEFYGGLVVRIPGCHYSGPGSIPDWGTEILQAAQRSQNKNRYRVFKKILYSSQRVSFTSITFPKDRNQELWHLSKSSVKNICSIKKMI